MAVDRYHLIALQTLAVVETGHARAPVVTLEYEGVEPPLDLLSCLRLLGFSGLVPQPPPSSAIDWGATGGTSATPTIRPYRATVRSSFGGGADVAERAVDAVRLVLEQLTPREAIPEAPAPSVPAATASRPTLAASVLAQTRERMATMTERPAGSKRAPHTGGPRRPPPSPASPGPSGPVWDVEVVVDRGDATAIRALLAEHGTVLEEDATTWTAEVAYRGQRSETRHPAVRLRAAISADEREALLAELSQRRLRSVDLVG